MHVNDREIGPEQPPYVIAEAGANHNGNLDEALRLIKAAKDCGADAVKFQCYTPDEITLDSRKPDFVIKDGPWKGRRLYELYEAAHTPRAWFPWLMEQGKRFGIPVFASVFSQEGVDFLETLDCPAYKIASMEIVDTPLIKYAASTDKPVIFSIGMASSQEIYEAMSVAPLALPLRCVSGYPTPINEAGMGGQFLAQPWGLSDHTLGITVPIVAVARGACAIEKHFTLDPNNGSEDAPFSLEPVEFMDMTKCVREAWEACRPSIANSQNSSRQLRRSLYVTRDVRRGEVFTEQNVRSIRPSYGLPPGEIDGILGKRALGDFEAGTPMSWDMICRD